MRILKRIIMGIFSNFDQYVAKKDALKHLLSHLFMYLRVRIIFAAIENIHLVHLSFRTSAVSQFYTRSIYGTKNSQNNFVDFAVYLFGSTHFRRRRTHKMQWEMDKRIV